MSTMQTDEQSTRKKLRLPDPAPLDLPRNTQQNRPRNQADTLRHKVPYLRNRIREKEEKRRQRTVKRNERQRLMSEQSKNDQLSRGAFERTDERDWPKDTRNDQLRERSTKKVKDWLTKVRRSGRIQVSR